MRMFERRYPKIISLSGYKGSGKDAVFKELPKVFPQYTFKRLAWADPLKKEVSEIFGIDLKLLHANEETKNNTLTEIYPFKFNMLRRLFAPAVKFGLCYLKHSDRLLTVREVLQYWGTEVRRAQDPDYWIKQTIGRIDSHVELNDVLVLTDTRFPNELREVHKRQGISVWLDRKDHDQKESHSSEQSIADFTMFGVEARGHQDLEGTMRDLKEILQISKLSF